MFGQSLLQTRNRHIPACSHAVNYVIIAVLALVTGFACQAASAALEVPGDAIVPTDQFVGAAAAGRFSASPNGEAVFIYPLNAPAGRREIEPKLQAKYASNNGNGILGVGWSLEGLSAIIRCKRDVARDGDNSPVTFTDSDAFCLDGQRLVAFPNAVTGVIGRYGQAGTEYRTEQDSFNKIVGGPRDALGPISFEIRKRDGLILTYGSTLGSRMEGRCFRSTPVSLSETAVHESQEEEVRLSWALAEVRDRYGNNLEIAYAVDSDSEGLGYEQVPGAIKYTGSVDGSLSARREVRIQYEGRPDETSAYVGGLKVRSSRRIKTISFLAPNPNATSLIKYYGFAYAQSPNTDRSLLREITECDANRVCLPPSTFSYTSIIRDGFVDVATDIHDDTAADESASVGTRFSRLLSGDVDGDGCDDIIYGAIDGQGRVAQAAYRLSTCYAAIAAGAVPFPQPNPADLYQLAPPVPGAPNSKLPLITFTPAFLSPGSEFCDHSYGCHNQLTLLDFDLDARADLFSYVVSEDCGTFILTCDLSTVWDHYYATSAFLASSISSTQWTPLDGLFKGETHTVYRTSTSKSLFELIPVGVFYYFSTYIGDINGDGFPDLIDVKTDGWSARLNRGRSLLPITGSCGSSGSACLALGGATHLSRIYSFQSQHECIHGGHR
jgi:Salmonella virulence plasmid 65kDa B protein